MPNENENENENEKTVWPRVLTMQSLTDYSKVLDEFRLSFAVGEIVRNDVYAENERANSGGGRNTGLI